jgi:hypothetical protein
MPPGAGDGSRFDTGRRGVSDLLGWMDPAEWLAARAAEREQQAAAGEVTARPTLYRGTQFRSELEAGWARTLDHLSIGWEYEQRACRLPSGTFYLPDFWLPALRTFIEVKGTHGQRRHKPQELAKEVDEDVIVLIGWPPARKSVTPYFWESYLNWVDPLGYDTRLALCPGCSGWQWMRAQLSRNCRLCGVSHTGLLAKAGEIAFHPAEPDRPSWMDAH